MGPCFALPLAVLACCLLPADCCILCTKEARSALDSFQKNYLPGRLDFRQQNIVMQRLHNIYDERWEVESPEEILGYLDEKTVKAVSWNFVIALQDIIDTDVRGQQLLNELAKFQKQQRDFFFQKSIIFKKEVNCPNECGHMIQRVIHCKRCALIHFSCEKYPICGVRDVKVHEMEDLLLDCLLSWHHLSEGLTDYSFFRVWKKNSETLLHKGKEPILRKRLVTPKDAGNYRCVLGTALYGPATIIEYHVKVLTKKDQMEEPGTSTVPHHKTTPVHVTTIHVTTVSETTVNVTTVGGINGSVTTVDVTAANGTTMQNTTNSENPSNKTTVENPVEVTSPNTTAKTPGLFTTSLEPSLEPSQSESFLKGRLLWILIGFLIFLLLILGLRVILTLKKKKNPESSENGIEKEDPSQTMVDSAATDEPSAGSTAPEQRKVEKKAHSKRKIAKKTSKQSHKKSSKKKKK